ncbi:lipoyl domain-containing protein [Altererythrobacter arenosus]|uniref:Lipoyl domain-containing protein n=1 Tax=Altererythrobacter arenosus TaxID=3032592 RepID=A0ABY8FU13_9SPHN|nr:lipoyl domain-containing protein [Altererythrobacter sp. CAU 1644]WFL77740.1 lipoyl domain-containing protein [Altererythrobacter sp. CAU 1644]
MAKVKLKLPKLAVSMQSGTIAAWHVNDGESVSEGQKLYDVEGDKTTFEVESPIAGVVTRLRMVGDEIPVGTEVIEIDMLPTSA